MRVSASVGSPRKAPQPVRRADQLLLGGAVRLGHQPVFARLAVATVAADRGVAWPVLTAAMAPWRATRPAGVAGLAAVGLLLTFLPGRRPGRGHRA
jgi:hypothetical protein